MQDTIARPLWMHGCGYFISFVAWVGAGALWGDGRLGAFAHLGLCDGATCGAPINFPDLITLRAPECGTLSLVKCGCMVVDISFVAWVGAGAQWGDGRLGAFAHLGRCYA